MQLPILTAPAAPLAGTCTASTAVATPNTAGSESAREALYGEIQPLIRRLLRQYGEDPEFRSDLEGELYWRFCTLYASFDPERGVPLKPYLIRTLTAAAYTYSRSHWRYQRREFPSDGTNWPTALETHDPTGEWDDALEMGAAVQQLMEAIPHLPLRQRQVVIWRYYDSLSFEEIAERLSIQPASARSLLRHGLNTLRQRIRPK